MRLYIGKLLSDTLLVFLKNFKYIILICMFVYLPFNLVTLFVKVPNIDLSVSVSDQLLESYRSFIYMVLTLRSVFLPLVGAAYTYVAGQFLKGESITIPGILDVSLLKWPRLVFTAIFCLCVYSLTTFLVVLPIVFAVYFMFHQNIVATTNLWGFRAVKESMSMIKGHWWKMFGLGFVLMSLLISISLTNTVILFYITSFMSPIFSGLPILALGIGIIIKSFFDTFSSFPQLALALYFHNLKTERDKVQG